MGNFKDSLREVCEDNASKRGFVGKVQNCIIYTCLPATIMALLIYAIIVTGVLDNILVQLGTVGYYGSFVVTILLIVLGGFVSCKIINK